MENNKQGLKITTKSFITATVIIFVLMAVCYSLTFVISGGLYQRDEAGKIIENTYQAVKGGMPFWKWILSPFLVLASNGSSTLISVIVFLLVIGGVFNALAESGLMKYMLEKITYKFIKSRYKLVAIIIFFFMAMGSLIGSFEECVPLVPIVVALAVSLGFDAYTGFAMSLLAVGSGFASGVFNPFTVGVAQKLSGLDMFSGVWLRAVAFVLIYALLLSFTLLHAKKVAKPIEEAEQNAVFNQNAKLDKALVLFASIIGVGILATLLSPFITFLQDYTMIIIALAFLVAGILAPLVAGLSYKATGKTFLVGIVGMLPAVLMILMASSIKFTLEESKILDTILYSAVGLAEKLPSFAVILFIYLIVLVMNFFVASGSAKAFMLIPLIVPLASVFNISAQLCVVAFAFGDGFSNVFYPTNPALLISLGLVDMNYGKWVKFSWLFQLLNLLLTCGLLLLGLAVGY